MPTAADESTRWGEDQLPPGVTLDPKAQAELEQAFGVSSNAEELVRANANRYSREQIMAQRARIDVGLTSKLYEGDEEIKLDENGQVVWSPDSEREFKKALIDLIGHPIEDAVVRGSGRRAVISYVFISPRGGLEKDIIPFKGYADKIGAKPKRSAGTPQSHRDDAGASGATGASGPKGSGSSSKGASGAKRGRRKAS